MFAARRFTGLVAVFGALLVPLLPLATSGHALAASQTITQEITVTAIVPSHRDIIIDKNGQIVQISSNTRDDVTPTVFIGSIEPANERPLTGALLAAYRQHVPEGTAKYGILYKRLVVAKVATSTTQPFINPPFFSQLLNS